MQVERLLLAGAMLLPACSSGDGGDRTRAPSSEATGPAREGDRAEVIAPEAVSVRGFPALRNLEGERLANGDFAQWLEEGRLHTRIRYDFEGGRHIGERAVFSLGARLRQERWSWREDRDGRTVRHFEVDFERGTVSGEKHEGGEVSRWDEDVDVQPGAAYAGFGFNVALKTHRDRLVAGDPVTLDAVVFTPDPRVVPVELSHAGVEEMRMAGRVLKGDRFDLEPQIPWIVDLFVQPPGTRIWLTQPPAAEFLRWEGPLLEPDDPVVRVDVLPGPESGPARPAATPAP